MTLHPSRCRVWIILPCSPHVDLHEFSAVHLDAFGGRQPKHHHMFKNAAILLCYLVLICFGFFLHEKLRILLNLFK